MPSWGAITLLLESSSSWPSHTPGGGFTNTTISSTEAWIGMAWVLFGYICVTIEYYPSRVRLKVCLLLCEKAILVLLLTWKSHRWIFFTLQ